MENLMFDESYEVILADTETARRIHYQLRYQVYCLDEGFEEHSKYPDGMERDDWDDHAVHFIVQSKQTREWIAAMRLILPQQKSLPVEELCDIDSRVMEFNSNENIAEISRICVKNTFRHKQVLQPITNRTQESLNMWTSPVTKAYSNTPERVYKKSEIMLGLLRAASVFSQNNNIHNWCFLTTPALARLISQMNIQLIRVGPACLHRGKRFPFLANLKEAERRIRNGCTVVENMFKRHNLAYRRFSELECENCYDDMFFQTSMVA